jgi:hypothetical protein
VENSKSRFQKIPKTKHRKVAETPNVNFLHSDVRNFRSNVRNLHPYTYTENTTEITNKEHRAGACEGNF